MTVCNKRCEFSSIDSNSSTATCKVPAIATAYSNEQFKIFEDSDDLQSGSYFGSHAGFEKAFDNNTMTDSGTPKRATCHTGLKFSEGFVGMISQVKFFLHKIVLAEYSGKMKFQGSNDGTTYTTLFTLNDNAHDGWNYYSWSTPADYPKFRFYRFYQDSSGACQINEIKLRGVEVRSDTTQDLTCDAKLVSAGQTVNLNPVAYKSALTPVLHSISPRHGSVLGGTNVTFSGQGFSTVPSDYTIILDGINCVVQ